MTLWQAHSQGKATAEKEQSMNMPDMGRTNGLPPTETASTNRIQADDCVASPYLRCAHCRHRLYWRIAYGYHTLICVECGAETQVDIVLAKRGRKSKGGKP